MYCQNAFCNEKIRFKSHCLHFEMTAVIAVDDVIMAPNRIKYSVAKCATMVFVYERANKIGFIDIGARIYSLFARRRRFHTKSDF